MSQAVVRQAGARAQEQAHLRRQGGQTIVLHVAVQQLLSHVAVRCTSPGNMLAAGWLRPGSLGPIC